MRRAAALEHRCVCALGALVEAIVLAAAARGAAVADAKSAENIYSQLRLVLSDNIGPGRGTVDDRGRRALRAHEPQPNVGARGLVGRRAVAQRVPVACIRVRPRTMQRS